MNSRDNHRGDNVNVMNSRDNMIAWQDDEQQRAWIKVGQKG